MKKTILVLFLVIFSVIGILDASFVTYEKIAGRVPPCTTFFKCGEVLESPYAYIGPLPLSVYGLVFYSVFLVLSGWYLLNLDFADIKLGHTLAKFLLVWGMIGAGFSVYLLFLMAMVIKAWCLYCLISAVNCILLATISWAVYTADRHQK